MNYSAEEYEIQKTIVNMCGHYISVEEAIETYYEIIESMEKSVDSFICTNVIYYRLR